MGGDKGPGHQPAPPPHLSPGRHLGLTLPWPAAPCPSPTPRPRYSRAPAPRPLPRLSSAPRVDVSLLRPSSSHTPGSRRRCTPPRPPPRRCRASPGPPPTSPPTRTTRRAWPMCPRGSSGEPRTPNYRGSKCLRPTRAIISGARDSAHF